MALKGLLRCSCTVASSVATASRTMDRSASDAGLALMPFMVKATSRAVSGSPSVKRTSSRMVKVQVRPSGEHS